MIRRVRPGAYRRSGMPRDWENDERDNLDGEPDGEMTPEEEEEAMLAEEEESDRWAQDQAFMAEDEARRENDPDYIAYLASLPRWKPDDPVEEIVAEPSEGDEIPF